MVLWGAWTWSLVDAISSLGSKKQLHHEIVTIHGSKMLKKWFNFLSSIYISTDNSKEYHLVDAAEAANIRANKRGEF